MGRGYFYCSCTAGDPITGPNAISTSDLTGLSCGSSGTWTCTEIPIDDVSHYTMRALQLLEKLGIDLFA